MININECLLQIFDYERVISDGYAALLYSNQNQKERRPSSNVTVSNGDFVGTADFLHKDTYGLVVYDYSYENEVSMSGPKLRAPFQELQNCGHHYFGVKLNILAYLHGGKIKELGLRHLYNNKTINIRPNLTLAQRFLEGFQKEYNQKISQPVELEPKVVEPNQQILFV